MPGYHSPKPTKSLSVKEYAKSYTGKRSKAAAKLAAKKPKPMKSAY